MNDQRWKALLYIFVFGWLISMMFAEIRRASMYGKIIKGKVPPAPVYLVEPPAEVVHRESAEALRRAINEDQEPKDSIGE